MRLRATFVLLLVTALAGCGGGGAKKPVAAAKASPAAVVRGWADDLRAGRYAAADKRFGLPATVANGSPEVKLHTRADVDAFNRSLSCAAIVTKTEPANGGRLLVTFTLTDRPGDKACGPGVGASAQITVRVRDGLIVEWLRVNEAPAGSTQV